LTPPPAATLRHADGRWRCSWCGTDPLYVAYHDDEWGVPVHADRQLFEMLCLEGAQAGLSWITVLRKRDNYRRAFDAFDPQKIARYTPRRWQALLADPGIVRNRLKVQGFTLNARAWLELCERHGGGAAYLWQFAATRRKARPRRRGDVQASTPQSDAMSRELKRLGFKFVGSTICHAFMQAVGMVDDHQQRCWVPRRRTDST
jgi:DNA-3-methyladenine glycosylase I